MSMSFLDHPTAHKDYRPTRIYPVHTQQTDLWKLLEDPALSQGYRHLTLTLLANGPDCNQVRKEMDTFCAAELKGQAAHRTFPEIWLHLQACPRCREFHDLVHLITHDTLPLEDGWDGVKSITSPV